MTRSVVVVGADGDGGAVARGRAGFSAVPGNTGEFGARSDWTWENADGVGEIIRHMIRSGFIGIVR